MSDEEIVTDEMARDMEVIVMGWVRGEAIDRLLTREYMERMSRRVLLLLEDRAQRKAASA